MVVVMITVMVTVMVMISNQVSWLRHALACHPEENADVQLDGNGLQ